jgi:hypothetical protein
MEKGLPVRGQRTRTNAQTCRRNRGFRLKKTSSTRGRGKNNSTLSKGNKSRKK